MEGESTDNVIVVAALLMRKQFLESNENYNEVTELLLNSDEERMFRKLAIWFNIIIYINNKKSKFSFAFNVID
jgi:hypothetical protein